MITFMKAVALVSTFIAAAFLLPESGRRGRLDVLPESPPSSSALTGVVWVLQSTVDTRNVTTPVSADDSRLLTFDPLTGLATIRTLACGAVYSTSVAPYTECGGMLTISNADGEPLFSGPWSTTTLNGESYLTWQRLDPPAEPPVNEDPTQVLVLGPNDVVLEAHTWPAFTRYSAITLRFVSQ